MRDRLKGAKSESRCAEETITRELKRTEKQEFRFTEIKEGIAHIDHDSMDRGLLILVKTEGGLEIVSDRKARPIHLSIHPSIHYLLIN